MSSTLQLPPKPISTRHVETYWCYIQSVLHYLFLAPTEIDGEGNTILPRLARDVYVTVYNGFFNACPPLGAVREAKILLQRTHTYLTLVVETSCREVLGDAVTETWNGDAGEQLIDRYLSAWARFNNGARTLDRLGSPLNKWIKRELAEGCPAPTYTLDEWCRDGVNMAATVTSGKAACDETCLLEILPMCFKKWRMLLVEKMGADTISECLKMLPDEEKQRLVEQLRKSFRAVGVRANKPHMAVLFEGREEEDGFRQ